MDYAVVIEHALDGSYSAYVPDLPGCVACGNNLEEAQQSIQEAVELHIQSLRSHGEPVPKPSVKIFSVHAA